ncbi:hypothetical protein BDV12DRAFT_164109 [Aspergillus spectabilis]
MACRAHLPEVRLGQAWRCHRRWKRRISIIQMTPTQLLYTSSLGPFYPLFTMRPSMHDLPDTSSNQAPFDDSITTQHNVDTVTRRTSCASYTRVFHCKWAYCHGSTIFHREADIICHISIHLSPGAHPCPEKDRRKFFGRKDHLQEHKKRRYSRS